ncbi:MAG: hypothetical protein P9F19_13315 [Candidatus Contendobacter sp.]|nr:hypothetical protein [Candidatus Contendobacter sp.]MDG4558349.1 hypothetical protein [Candidatus Contendobacter sp.]
MAILLALPWLILAPFPCLPAHGEVDGARWAAVGRRIIAGKLAAPVDPLASVL